MTAIIATEDESLGLSLQEILNRLPGLEITAEVTRPGAVCELAKRDRPEIIILDLDVQAATTWIEAVEAFLEQEPKTTFLVTSRQKNEQLILRAMRAGARDFLPQPFDEKELNAIFSRISKKHLAAKESSAKKIVAVFSNKGGTGVTAIAANLAVGLGQFERDRVALVDLVLQHGDISTFLNLAPEYTIADIIKNLERVDETFLKNSLTKHPSGIYVLTEPRKPEEADSITNAHINELLASFKTTFEYTVIDAGHQFDARTISALDMADTILLIFLLDLPTIRSTIRSLEILQRLGYTENKVKLVLNRYDPANAISLQEAQTTLAYPIYWKLPNDFNCIISSINQGLPVFEIAKNSELSQAFLKLAGLISEKLDFLEPTTKERGWDKERLFSFFHFPHKEKNVP